MAFQHKSEIGSDGGKIKSRNESGANSHGRIKLKSFKDNNNTCVSDQGAEREPTEEVKGTYCNMIDLSRRTEQF